MGTLNSFKVMRAVSVWTPLVALFVLGVELPTTIDASLCRPHQQFWDVNKESCVNCTKCTLPGEIVVRPCHVHQDTECGPLSALDIDWSWLKPDRSHKAEEATKPHPHHHHKQQHKHNHHHHRQTNEEEETLTSSSSTVADFAETYAQHKPHHNHHHQKHVGGSEFSTHHSKHSHEELDTLEDKNDTKRQRKLVSTDSLHLFTNQQGSRDSARKRAEVESDEDQDNQKMRWSSSEAARLLSQSEKLRARKHRKHDLWALEQQLEDDQESARLIEEQLLGSTSTFGDKKRTNTVPKPKPPRPPQSASQVKASPPPPPALDELERMIEADEDLRAEAFAPSTPEPFSAAEALVWDGQAVVLALAVFACLLFFLVAAAYSIHHARQWRRLKDSFEADVEELSARLSLMSPGGVTEPPDATAIMADGSNANQCIYMEQLLVRKQTEDSGKERGNVYIDRGVGKTTRQ